MDIKLKLELNLQQMAIIRVAANIWLSRPMIAEICDLFSKNITSSIFETSRYKSFKNEMKKWLTNNILEQVDLIKLPYVIKNDLLQIMRPVGENLLDYLKRTSERWNNSLFNKMSFPGLDVYCKYIEFDCIGIVDEVKTFLNIYNDSENISLLFLFFEACTYCLEDVMHSIWNKCSVQIKSHIQFVISTGGLLIDKSDMHKIQQYWLQFVDKNQLQLPYEITELDALKDCVKKTNTAGVKYFITKLNQDDKNKIILQLPQGLFHVTLSQNQEQHICNIFFLLAHMTEDNRNKFFFLNERRIISLLTKQWPWKYLLLNMDFFDKEIYYWMIEFIVEKIVDDYNFYKKTVYTDLWMISGIWKKNPSYFEKSIAEFCWSLKKPIMFKLLALILVTSVIDDTDGVNKLRSKIYKGFEKHCNTIIDEQKYEVVDLFLNNILRSDEERKSYKALLHSKNICCQLLLFKYFDNFDRYLNWRFDNDHVQITQFKKDFTADIVFITLLCHVLKIHETHFEIHIGILFLILNFDPSYQKQFKQSLIKHYHFIAHLRKYIKDDPKHFNHILTYFQFSAEEIVEIKKKF